MRSQYTVALGELRHRLENLAAAVRRMEEEAEERDGESQPPGCSGCPTAEVDIELTCGARVRLAARAT